MSQIDAATTVAQQQPTNPVPLYHMDRSISFPVVSTEESQEFMDKWLVALGEDPADYQ